jgi:hypothetical protein
MIKKVLMGVVAYSAGFLTGLGIIYIIREILMG